MTTPTNRNHDHRAVMLVLIIGTNGCISRPEPVTPTARIPGLENKAPSEPSIAAPPSEHQETRKRQDLATAVAEAEELCDLGHGERCVRLGLAYAKPPAEDLAKAAAKFTRGCQLGDAWGCLEFGEALLAGRGVDVDRAQAIAKIGQACEMGLAHACGHEIFPQANPEEMTKTAEKDCVRGSAAACMKAGDMLLRGGETAQDIQRALRHLKRACKAGFRRGCQAIASVFELGIGTRIDEKRAVRLYRQYCAAGDLDSCCYLGQLAAEGRMLPFDPKQALVQWDSACTRGSMTCCLNAGIVLSDGASLPADPVRALGYLHRSCDGGEQQGCVALGERLEHGLGGAGVQLVSAAAAYLRACELGHFKSCERVLELRRSVP